MGSLMAGWQTNPLDEKAAIKRSKSSVTKEEVERFWKSKGQPMGRQLSEGPRNVKQVTRSIVVPTSPGSDSGQSSRSGGVWESPPMTPTTPSGSSLEESNGERSPAWWRKSYWAFLNEPPILEETQSRYVSQYHVGAPKSGSTPYTVVRTDHESNVYLTNPRTSVVN